MGPGLYVHIPFCAALCPYCDFAVVVGAADRHGAYIDALLAEYEASGWSGPFGSVFVGGGTPSFVEPGSIARVLERAPRAPEAEVSIEANPESVTRAVLDTLVRAGLNRLSIGAQSFVPAVLRALGRAHGPAEIDAAVAAARAAGIGNVNLDLIFGGPGESDADWLTSLKTAIGLGVEHLSCYALTIEERTAFGRAVARGAMPAPDDDVLAGRYEIATEVLERAGYRCYEISNFARPGFECRHNLSTWMQGDYLGLGIGAHSHRAGHRWWNTRSLSGYLADPAGARESEELLDDRQRAEEWLSLRLRLADGVDLTEARARIDGIDEAVTALAEAGLIATGHGRARLTVRGRLLDNEVTARLLGLSTH